MAIATNHWNNSSNIRVTPEGGLAIILTNKTGAASVKGTLVQPSNTTANAVKLAAVGEADISGVMYEDGVPDGSSCWVVISGIADVFFVGDVVLEYMARLCASGDTGAANGKAISEAVPTSPFATDKHFQEIGHCIEARTGAGLAKVVLHFN